MPDKVIALAKLLIKNLNHEYAYHTKEQLVEALERALDDYEYKEIVENRKSK